MRSSGDSVAIAAAGVSMARPVRNYGNVGITMVAPCCDWLGLQLTGLASRPGRAQATPPPSQRPWRWGPD